MTVNFFPLKSDFKIVLKTFSLKVTLIAVGRLVELLEKMFLTQEKKSEYLPKMVLELLWDA